MMPSQGGLELSLFQNSYMSNPHRERLCLKLPPQAIGSILITISDSTSLHLHSLDHVTRPFPGNMLCALL